MTRFLLRSTLLAAIALTCGQATFTLAVENANARFKSASNQTEGEYAVVADGTPYGSPDVGYNYYAHPGSGVAAAGLYPAPHPTPAVAGHTMYTYQPLMPHEYLYEHDRVYYTPYAGPEAFYSDPYNCGPKGSGYNKTTVIWQSGSHHFSPHPIGIYGMSRLQSRLDQLKGMVPKIGCNNCQ